MKRDTETPSSNPQIAFSDCCKANVITKGLTIFQKISGSFKTYCEKCDKECTYKWYPVYRLVSKGTYRKIIY